MNVVVVVISLGKKKTYEPYDDQIAVLDFSVSGPHLGWRLLQRAVSDYSTTFMKRKRASRKRNHVNEAEEILFPKPNLWKSR